MYKLTIFVEHGIIASNDYTILANANENTIELFNDAVLNKTDCINPYQHHIKLNVWLTMLI